MAKFIGQIFSWLATDVIVKTLANNKVFQRTVLKVDKFQTQVERMAEEKGEEAVKAAIRAKDAASKVAKEKVETIKAQAQSNAQAQRENAEAVAERASTAGTQGGRGTTGVVVGGFNVTTFIKHLKGEVRKDFGSNK